MSDTTARGFNSRQLHHMHETGPPLTDPYRCEWCSRRYVVPSLARDCEDDHMTEDVCKPSTDAPMPGAHV